MSNYFYILYPSISENTEKKSFQFCVSFSSSFACRHQLLQLHCLPLHRELPAAPTIGACLCFSAALSAPLRGRASIRRTAAEIRRCTSTALHAPLRTCGAGAWSSDERGGEFFFFARWSLEPWSSDERGGEQQPAAAAAKEAPERCRCY